MYRYLVSTDDRIASAIDSNGAIATTPQPFAISAGVSTGVFVQMHSPSTIAVQVVDELGRQAPVKIQLLGHDARINPASGPVDGRNILYSLGLGERVRVTAFDGTDRYIENAWWTVDGRLEAQVRPGTYDVVVTRGPEYEIATQTVTIGAGQFATAQMSLQRSFSTPGWIAGDFHVHSGPSTDSGLPIADRVASCAAEGLDVAVATDHNYITDYAPVIAAQKLDQWLLGIPGMELTTFEMGHFNGYPLKVDPGSTRGGEFVWAKQPPQKLFDQLRQLAIDPTNSIVQINHPRQQVLGYFAQFFVDADDRAALRADRHHGHLRAVRRRVRGGELLARCRCDRAPDRSPDRGRPHVRRAESAAARTVPRPATGDRDRSSSVKTATRCFRAPSRLGSRCSIAATA